MKDNDKKITLYEINIKEDLKPGSLVQIKYGKQIVGKYFLVQDEYSCVEKYKLIETVF